MNIRPLIKRLLVLGAMLSWLPLPACGGLPVYSAAPIEGWVVDADTNQPLEGVIVTANWQLVSGTLAGGEIPKGQLMVMESVTDKNGRFRFEGWTKANPTTGELRNKDPQILMFKRGYRYRVFTNDYPVDQVVMGFKRESKLNKQTVKLERFKGDSKAYAGYLDGITVDLRFVEDECSWTKVPNLVLALHEQYWNFRNKALSSALPSFESLELRDTQRRCPSPKDALTGRKQ